MPKKRKKKKNTSVKKRKSKTSLKEASGFEQLEKTYAMDVMSTSLIVIRPGEPYRMAVELLTEKRLTVLPVVGKSGKLKGLLSEKDILQASVASDHQPEDFLDLPIRYIRDIESVYLDTELETIADILANRSYRHLPVVDEDGKLQGMITRRDLIRVIYLRLELAKVKEDLGA